MLVNPLEMIKSAQRGKYAVGSFNTSDLEITKAIINAAEKLKSPVMVETSEKAIAYAGLEEMAAFIIAAAKKAKVPVALHLDHGSHLEIVNKCLNVGYTSVMLDGSKLAYSENVIYTARAVVAAHRNKAACEGELGSIGGHGKSGKFTDPDEVPEFIKKTNVDFLAISFGSEHGIGADERLDIDLLEKIHKKTKTPLVLHGASGVPDKYVRLAIKNGISKINIDTDIRHTFSKTIYEIKNKFKEPADPRDIMGKVMAEIQKVVEQKIKLFGSNNKA